VRHHHIRVALQRVEVVARKTFARLGRNEQRGSLLDERGCGFIRQRSFRSGIERLVHRHNELRERMQPREPRIVREQLQEMVRGGNRPDVLLVAHALGIHQRLVQLKQRFAKLGQSVSEIFRVLQIHARKIAQTAAPGEPLTARFPIAPFRLC